MSPTVILISGASRGLGRGLLERYLARPDHIVIAANRNPEQHNSRELTNLPKGSGTQLIVAKLDARSETDASEAAKDLEKQGIDHLDMVIANAGVLYAAEKVSKVKISDIDGHMLTNCYGVVRLYQAMLPLLLQSNHPKWITVGSESCAITVCPHPFETLYGVMIIAGVMLTSSAAETIDIHARNQYQVPNAPYAASKMAVHWLTKMINTEEESLTAFCIHPGWVQTDAGIGGARLYGIEMAPPQTIEDSVGGMIKVFDAATKESHGGRFWNYTGEEKTW